MIYLPRPHHFPMLGILVVANFATVSLGTPIGGEDGKFSLSNIMPVVSCAITLLPYLIRNQGIERRAVLFFLVFNVSAIFSYAVFLARFGWPPNIMVLAFQNVEILFCLLLAWYATKHPTEFRSAVRIGIYCSMVVMAHYALTHLGSVEAARPWWYLGMDDRSHTSVLLVSEAFILVRFFGGRIDCLAAVGLFLLSLATTSRLPVLFAPAILLALAMASRFGKLVVAAILGTAVIVFINAGELITQTFAVLERISSVGAVTGEGSTQSHMLLIQSALVTKFSDPAAFLFGIGPGNFSKALVSFQFFLPELAAVDPGAADSAYKGTTPAHSTPASFLLDFNVLIDLFIVYLMLRAAWYLLRNRDFIGLTFAGCFLVASMFYSFHNKPYFFLVIITICILTVAVHGGRKTERSLPSAPSANRIAEEAIPSALPEPNVTS